VEKPLAELRPGEVLLKVLYVPIHGSFWLASHPDGIHPRSKEFLADGGFVFGNGGVGQIVAIAENCERARPGDFVSVMGHLPCKNDNCYACRTLHRYTECDFGEGKIVGHGKGAPDGMYARYCIMPESALDFFSHAGDRREEEKLMPYMFGFLMADVLNAMTRDPGALQKKRMLLIGAGNSGHLAAWLLLHFSPQASIFVVDIVEEKLKSIERIAPESIETVVLPTPIEDTPDICLADKKIGGLLERSIDMIDNCMEGFFGRQKCDLVFDASSGNTTPLWANKQVLGPEAHCIPFGFGSKHLMLSSECLQISGLKIMISRGVGDVQNRKDALALIRKGAGDMIYRHLIRDAHRLDGLEQALGFIRKQHELPPDRLRGPQAYIVPNTIQDNR